MTRRQRNIHRFNTGVVLALPVTMRTTRYRLSRTSWCGIRFSFCGPAKDYLAIILKGTLLTIITFGGYYPFYAARKRAWITSHVQFGNMPFAFDGTGTQLLKIYLQGIVAMVSIGVVAVFSSALLAWVVSPWLALGVAGMLLCFPWFFVSAERQRLFWNHTLFREGRGHCTIEFENLALLKVVNFILLVLSFGLAWPWTRVRNIKFLYRRQTFSGPFNLAGITQERTPPQPAMKRPASSISALIWDNGSCGLTTRTGLHDR